MNRKNLLFVAGAGLIFLASCQSPKDQIVRKWQVENVEVPGQDSMMKAREKSIDTITVLDSNMAMFMGTNNLDSFKMLAKQQMAESKKQQEEQVKQMSMTFLKDGIMLQEGGGRTDSAKWVMSEDSKKITLSPLVAQPGAPSSDQVFLVDKISGSNLRLKIEQPQGNVFINFKAAGEQKAEPKKEEKK